MIKAVFFDVGNTLLYPYPNVGEVMSRVLARFGYDIPGDTLESNMIHFYEYYGKVYEQDSGLWSEHERQREMWIEGYSMLCRRVGIEGDTRAIAQEIYIEFDRPECWKLFDGVPETFQEIKRRGYKIGLISNWGAGLGELMEGLGLGILIDAVIASAEVGTHKPEAKIFFLALEALGVEPAEAMHVGDHVVADIEGAGRLGITPVLIAHATQTNFDPTATVHVPDVACITSIPQILDLL